MLEYLSTAHCHKINGLFSGQLTRYHGSSDHQAAYLLVLVLRYLIRIGCRNLYRWQMYALRERHYAEVPLLESNYLRLRYQLQTREIRFAVGDLVRLPLGIRSLKVQFTNLKIGDTSRYIPLNVRKLSL